MAAATFAVLAVAPVAVEVFEKVHDDDLMLVRSMEDGTLDPSILDGTNLDRILIETLGSERPDEQRLILLKDALEQQAAVTSWCASAASSPPTGPRTPTWAWPWSRLSRTPVATRRAPS